MKARTPHPWRAPLRLPGWARLWLRDSGVLLASQGTALLATTALAVLVARSLGPADYGVFAGFLGLSIAVSAFVDLGAVTLLMRELSDVVAHEAPETHHARSSDLMTPAVAVMSLLLTALLVGTIAVSAIWGISVRLSLALTGLMAYTGLVTVAGALETAFRAHRQLATVFVVSVGEKAALLGMVASALGLGLGMPGIAAAYTLAGIGRLSFDAWRIHARQLAGRGPLRGSDMRRTVLASLPIGVASSAPSAAVRLDIFGVSLLSSATAGLYGVAERFILALSVIPISGSSALYPLLARHTNRGRASLYATLLLGVTGGLLALIAGAAAHPLVLGLFGAKYRKAVPAMRVMLVAVPLIFASAPLMAGLFSQGLERAVLWVTIPATFLGIGFVMLGETLDGAVGACAGFVLQYAGIFLGLVLLAFLAPRRELTHSTSWLGPPRVEASLAASLDSPLGGEVP